MSKKEPEYGRNRTAKARRTSEQDRINPLGPEEVYAQTRDLLSLPEDPTHKSITPHHGMFPKLNKKIGDRCLAVASMRL